VIVGGDSSGALWQYCHCFRAALGMVDRMAPIPRPEVRFSTSLAIAYVVIAALTWRYFFMAPGILATIVALLLTVAALS